MIADNRSDKIIVFLKLCISAICVTVCSCCFGRFGETLLKNVSSIDGRSADSYRKFGRLCVY